MPGRARAPAAARERPGAVSPGGRAAAAIAAFLDAVLPPGARRDAELAGTPGRVAEAWLEDLVDGYREDPAALLAEAMPARGRGLVAVTGIDYHSMCPHHLLPSRGVAHVAYLPGAKVVGFGQLARLVDCFAHRLVLQEDLARLVAEALVTHLGARGAGCVLEAEQSCFTVRGERRRGARTHAQCFVGELADEGGEQAAFRAAIDRAARRQDTASRPTRAASGSRSASRSRSPSRPRPPPASGPAR